MQIRPLLDEVETLRRRDADADVTGVEYDSRRVVPGSLFVAMRGETTDGNRYVDAAIKQGAVAIVTDSADVFEKISREHSIAVAQVASGRRALAEISAAFFDHPEKKLKLTAATGTNGKTTTAFLLEGLLRSAKRSTVLLGTIEMHIGDKVLSSPHTTPESRDVLDIFAQGVQAGATEAVMEMSSHALEQERVWRLPVDVAIFTNLTQDHLDYHGTMERYTEAKAKLFQGVGAPPPRVAIINVDDAYASQMLDVARECKQVWSYGQSEGAEFRISQIALHAGKTSFQLTTPFGEAEVHSLLSGAVNVYNLTAAIAAAMARGLSLQECVQAAAKLQPVPGRFQTVPNQLGIAVVVDYAHTEDALTNLIALARELSGKHRVITVFGCGGDRDRTKRPKMGRAAGQGSDFVIVTSDNPRSEDPRNIADEVLQGLLPTDVEYMVELDRRDAIEAAIRMANRGDIVLIAGKGHEKEQILRGGAVPFDDVAVAAEILRALEGKQ
ncbi:MAG: UDP-N-acetylmuramoyl-L-alanyl-D-glutamate--2,6-diaminopimelate ligase [Acidobacteria bacterium]|nr:UDP-N-acetylmuramoyl-L-alanyl-D-glutamate--2,6-diaminopimelate ligase [Acidobacteriota bacterium]